MRVVWERQRPGEDTIEVCCVYVPDVVAYSVDLSTQKFIIVASDASGLWNVMTPAKVVQFVGEYRNEEQREVLHKPINVVGVLIREALDQWERKRLPVDNIAVLIAFLSREPHTEYSRSWQGDIYMLSRGLVEDLEVHPSTAKGSIVQFGLQQR